MTFRQARMLQPTFAWQAMMLQNMGNQPNGNLRMGIMENPADCNTTNLDSSLSMRQQIFSRSRW